MISALSIYRKRRGLLDDSPDSMHGYLQISISNGLTIIPLPRRPPVQPPLDPEPRQPRQEDEDEGGDMDEPGEPQFIPGHGPGEDEDRLHVEDDEEDGHQ